MSVSCTISGIHRVSKNVPSLACYNFDTHERILIFLVKKCMDYEVEGARKLGMRL